MLKQGFHFAPYLKSVIWGGHRLAEYKGLDTPLSNVGESWEISDVPGLVSVVDRGSCKGLTLGQLIDLYGADLLGEDNYRKHGGKFPLLIKFIDAAQNLSVQVHPNDQLAKKRHNSVGKTEMWHILETTDNAKIYTGLSKNITSDEYAARVTDNSIMDVIAEYDSKAGDTFFLPAGRIHAIGAGNLLVEIQQTSDITYRIYDYDRRDASGKPRELHTELAREAIDYKVYSNYKTAPEGDLLVDCNYFKVNHLSSTHTEKSVTIPHDRDSFTIIICTGGLAIISSDSIPEQYRIQQGETYLFPASITDLKVSGIATILTVQS